VTVRAGGDVVTREGIGTGFGRAPSEEAAHEIALKAAETDATKRALATFGNPFGLALYDEDQTGVTRATQPAASPKPESQLYVLARNEGNEASFQTPQTFADVAIAEIRELDSTEALYAFAKRNKGTFAHLRRAGPGMVVLMDTIGLTISARAQVLRRRRNVNATVARDRPTNQNRDGELAFPKERSVRNKEHLQFVAQQPCLICGRRPTHAHHVRFAERRALGMKVSDEFTVPLCSVHHDAVHRIRDERRWWARQAIDPLATANRLWVVTQRGGPEQRDAAEREAADNLPSSPTIGSANGSEDASGADKSPR